MSAGILSVNPTTTPSLNLLPPPFQWGRIETYYSRETPIWNSSEYKGRTKENWLGRGGEGSSTIYSDTTKFFQPAPPPFTSSKKHSSSWYEKSKGSTYIITGITISIRPQSFGSGIILETLRALHFFHVVLRKFRVAIRGAAAMIQNKSCNATFPQDAPGYNKLENSWHAPLLSRFFFQNLYFHLPLSHFSVTWS